MGFADLWSLVVQTLSTQRLRSFLTILGIVIGIASVVLLASIGEGTRLGIARQFSQFGTTIVGVKPGKSKTLGMSPGALGGTTHPLTIDDATALKRIAGVRYVAGNVAGLGAVKAGERSRHVMIYGTVYEDQFVLDWRPRIGAFLPPGDPERIAPVCVLGATTAQELFPGQNPLLKHVRVGERRFTVIGVMSRKGQVLGVDLDDMVFIPLVRAMRMFNRVGVDEIHLFISSHSMIPSASEKVRRALMSRHNGEEDFTVVSQADMLGVVDRVLSVVAGGVIAIAAISVFVGAIGILTIMWVAVHQRRREIGLIKAIGASDRQVLLLFLTEAAVVSVAGGAVGLGLGFGSAWLLRTVVPGFWAEMPSWIVPIALGASLLVGIVAGVVPALRAARLDPVDALHAE